MKLNNDVSGFLDQLDHPFRKEIQQLRRIILSAEPQLSENIKWNGPNYSIGQHDRITMRIHPPKKIQLIFHRGAKAQEQPKEKLIQDEDGLLIWKGNDRAIATFNNMAEIENKEAGLTKIIKDWIWV